MHVLGFQFYNFKTKEVEDVVALDFGPSSHIIVCTHSGNWEYREDVEVDGVLLHNTGFKDKDNVPIFEGDILDWDDPGFDSHLGPPEPFVSRIVVSWSEENGWFEFKDIYGDEKWTGGDLDIQYITRKGNIYENKELLEQ